MPKCRHARSFKASITGKTACYCAKKPDNPPPGGAWDKYKDVAIMGWADGGGWWDRCMKGKDRHGVTPSRCIHY